MVETTHKLYALEAWRTEFDQLTSIEKQWLVLTELYRIDKKGGGKLRRENVVEFDIFVELLGGKWRKHPETLPDLLDVDPVEIPVPEDDEDEGESVDLED